MDLVDHDGPKGAEQPRVVLASLDELRSDDEVAEGVGGHLDALHQAENEVAAVHVLGKVDQVFDGGHGPHVRGDANAALAPTAKPKLPGEHLLQPLQHLGER